MTPAFVNPVAGYITLSRLESVRRRPSTSVTVLDCPATLCEPITPKVLPTAPDPRGREVEERAERHLERNDRLWSRECAHQGCVRHQEPRRALQPARGRH